MRPSGRHCLCLAQGRSVTRVARIVQAVMLFMSAFPVHYLGCKSISCVAVLRHSLDLRTLPPPTVADTAVLGRTSYLADPLYLPSLPPNSTDQFRIIQQPSHYLNSKYVEKSISIESFPLSYRPGGKRFALLTQRWLPCLKGGRGGAPHHLVLRLRCASDC